MLQIYSKFLLQKYVFKQNAINIKQMSKKDGATALLCLIYLNGDW